MIQKVKRNFHHAAVDFILWLKKITGIHYSTIQLKNGSLLRFRNSDLIGVELLKNGDYEKISCAKMLGEIASSMVVLDIGANIGFYTVQLARKVGSEGRVFSFEPNPKMMRELESNIQLNRLQNVTMEHVALSDSTGTAKLFLPVEGKEGHGSLSPNDTFAVHEEIEVKTDTLDRHLKKYTLSRIDAIKIDVEGAELSVFRGAQQTLKKYKPAIYFECSENLCRACNHSVYDVLSFLHTFGYELENIDVGMWVAQIHPARKTV